jgi:acetylornithine deacetylase/succinyl-diaminopimelate desuccinylase-like protein
MFEGEEEVGSANLGTFLEENKNRLSADVILVSDTSIIANDVPSITTGLRGIELHGSRSHRSQIKIYIPVCMVVRWPILRMYCAP